MSGAGNEKTSLAGLASSENTLDADSEGIRALAQRMQLPEANTRRAAILEAFQRGERLTTADALRRGWGWRLAADVHALREYGWDIRSILLDQGEGSQPIARYSMNMVCDE
jgi:hypothetical protein